MSSGTFSTKRDATTYRQMFTHRWSAFVRENFEGPEHVAFVFRVDNKTARNWWDGINAPSGFAVAYAIQNFPAAQDTLCGGAA